LCVCVAEGRTFLGYEVQQGDSIYINLEGPAQLFGAHLRKLGYTQSKGRIHLVNQTMPSSGDQSLEMLKKALAKVKPKIVVIDPVVKFLRLPDSDKNDFVSASLEKLEAAVREFKTHLMMLAHAKKRGSDDIGDSTLGSTGFRAAGDTNLFLTKGEKGTRVLSTEQRWGTALEPTEILFDEERGEMVLGRKVEEIEQSRQQMRKQTTLRRIRNEIFDFVLKAKSPTREQILEAVTGKDAVIGEALNSLCEEGKLVRQGQGTKTDPTRYRVMAVPFAESPRARDWVDEIAPRGVV